jgi:hypothetical protein
VGRALDGGGGGSAAGRGGGDLRLRSKENHHATFEERGKDGRVFGPSYIDMNCPIVCPTPAEPTQTISECRNRFVFILILNHARFLTIKILKRFGACQIMSFPFGANLFS